MSTVWKVLRTDDAKRDYTHIIRWTAERFGSQQTRIYKDTIKLALAALESGPNTLGVKQRNDLGDGILTLHVARNGRKGRHFIVFRIRGNDTIEVLRLLYDSMELTDHFSP